jgi:predicted nucleotidyltransferase
MMDTGLNIDTTSKICSIFKNFPQVEQAILYGSRALGTFKPSSDIDITLLGPALTQNLIWKIAQALDDSLLPYVIDLSLFDTLDNTALIEHISRVGIVFYQADFE